MSTAYDARQAIDEMVSNFSDEIAKITAERDAAQAEATRLHKALEVAEEKYAHWQREAMEYKTASVERAREALGLHAEVSALQTALHSCERERDAARIQRDECREEFKTQHEDVEMFLRQRDDARKQAEDRRRDLDWQNGMWADLARILGSDTRHPPALLKELEMRREPSEEMANELAELRTERQLWHKEMSERDEGWRTGWEKVQDHDRKWMEAMAILGMTGDLIGPDDVLAELRRRMPAPPSCAGTGPVVDSMHPTGRCTCAGEGSCDWCGGGVNEPGTTGDLKGLQNKVAEHSRTIGDLKDEFRVLRERTARLERMVNPDGDGKTVVL